ncbi:E3 ubiquitin-protein ligase ATL59-like isoform X2 [Humulus lupulus]|uniref:E3 ubiquitin-protein ligase ATL59-like isoform X2 n=1 Tax=Humulus lupulus TaxID=3486 RepID=UPI002B40236F|nr:E3 ubiquitin-protein ligase ATL59-like isoform X2 [Humulus lupulus]
MFVTSTRALGVLLPDPPHLPPPFPRFTHCFFSPGAELGLKKEVREMLPIVIYKESFSVRDTQCSVCLGDYEADDRLQQIPACGHTFHIHCIDLWLTSHTTCPLCRLSLLCSAKSSTELPNVQVENILVPSVAEGNTETSLQQSSQIHEQFFELRSIDSEAVARSHCVQHEKEKFIGQVVNA